MIVDFWTVEDGELVLYKRKGACNQCAACCCTHHITFQIEVGGNSGNRDDAGKDDYDWSEREGWSMFLAQGIWWYFKIMSVTTPHTPCGGLTPDKKCAEWKTDDFRPICRYWPFHPSNLKEFPKCGFGFERQEEHTNDGR